MPVLTGFPYCAATPRLRSKLPTSTLTTTNSLATSSAFLVLFSEASSARQSSHQLAPKITSTERFVAPAATRACSMSAFAFAVSSYGSPAATAPPARARIAVERTRWNCMMAPSRGEWLSRSWPMRPEEGTYLAHRQGNSFLGLLPREHAHFG